MCVCVCVSECLKAGGHWDPHPNRADGGTRPLSDHSVSLQGSLGQFQAAAAAFGDLFRQLQLESRDIQFSIESIMFKDPLHHHFQSISQFMRVH